MPKAGVSKWLTKSKWDSIEEMLVVPTGVPIPKTLHAVCHVKELECGVTNCVNNANA
jgi:hypothetical protein